ncbi:putative amidase PB8B6.03 [Mycena venus]|uniref:amidase n=1 Tax=Mycena venus TaxID=2733690 RepID=A0A8H7CJT9_9AGAR|nr:putative amidase PB8B6.03 [Mycena venus]
MWPFSSGYQVLAEAKQKERDSFVSAAPNFSHNEHGGFLKATASEIVYNIERGEWTASQVVSAYIAQAALAQKTTNCITEGKPFTRISACEEFNFLRVGNDVVMFSKALEQAQDLDAEFASTKKLRGPLHGVPLSVKDQFNVEGFDTSIGYSERVGKPANSDADVVALLKAAGAIPIAKTNVPQTMFAFECCNPIFGRSVNPHNGGFTCGGSSGGEGALLAMDGSALGIGSDVGGSLRIPAAFCGVYSLKPSPLRVSYAGSGVTVPGFEGIISVAGPMGRSVKDLEMFSRVVFGVQNRSNVIAPILYQEPKLPEKLRFGYYTDNYIKGSPANKRAISETVTALQKQGHECIEIVVPDQIDAFNIFIGLTSADGYKTLLSGIGSDPLDSSLLVVARGSALPRFLRSFASWVVSFFLKDEKFAGAIASTGAKSMQEYLRWVARRDRYNAKFYEEVWNKHQLDGIIAPVLPVPQVQTGAFTTLFALASGTTLYNLINCPSGSMPVTKVNPAKDKITEEWTKAPLPSLVERALYQGKNPIYDPVAMQGMPVGIQVVGRKWEDEKVLAMMQVVDAALGKDRGFGPGSFSKA